MLQLFNKPIRAFIFDLDNCLIQSTIDFRKIKLRLLELINEGHHQDLHVRSFLNLRVDDIQLLSIAELLQHLKAISMERYQRALHLVEEEEQKGCQNVSAMPCADDLLVILTNYGLKLGLLTNNTRQVTTRVLKLLRWQRFFDHVVTRDDVREMKPSPEGLQLFLDVWELSPSDVLFVGDSWIDEVAASKVGIPFIGIIRKWQPGMYHVQKKALNRDSSTIIVWLDTLCKLKEMIDANRS